MKALLTQVLLAGGVLLGVASYAQQAQPLPHCRHHDAVAPGAHQTYGYEVLVNGKPMIAQPSIPGRPGNDGFRTPAEAQRVADLVASKLRDNQLPPAVTAADLQRLHAGQ